MSNNTSKGATIPEVSHHYTDVNGATLHYVAAGHAGSPILLIHGWPETWWAFHRLIPLLAKNHRVYAVDLRGFGDSSNDDTAYDEATFAQDIHALLGTIGVGPMHVLCQDISGGLTFRFAALHPGDVISLIAVECALAGFGLEQLADVNHGGSWHLGFLGAPGIPDMLLSGHERTFLGTWAYPMMTSRKETITETDLDEFARTYSRPNAWRGTTGLYQSIFLDQGQLKALAHSHPLKVPVLTVDAVSYPFTEHTFRQVGTGAHTAVRLNNVGHLVALEAPSALADAINSFAGGIDNT